MDGAVSILSRTSKHNPLWKGLEPMTEQNKELTTVRDHRHVVQDRVRTVQSALSNASGLLAGVTGLTQDQQVERFDGAAAKVSEAADAVGPVVAAIEAGKDLAATRDFAAWQAAKAARREQEAPADRPDPDVANPYGTDYGSEGHIL